jgi:hypothetical protein
MWKLFQLLIALAVLFSDVHWRWSNNGYATGLLAGFAAYAATCLIYSLRNWRSELVPRCFRKGLEERPPPSRVIPKTPRE